MYTFHIKYVLLLGLPNQIFPFSLVGKENSLWNKNGKIFVKMSDYFSRIKTDYDKAVLYKVDSDYYEILILTKYLYV